MHESECEKFPDDNEEIILASASISNTNINIFPLPSTNSIQEEYNPTPDANATVIDSVDTSHDNHDISVDDIHHEAHQIINDLQQNLKEISAIDSQQKRNPLPTIIQETDIGIEDNLPSISNSAILQPLIERQNDHNNHHHHHEHDEEKMRKILGTTKDKWSVKMEGMIANTDSWFINEDGDIVLIYPEVDQVNNTNKVNDDMRDEDKLKIDLEIDSNAILNANIKIEEHGMNHNKDNELNQNKNEDNTTSNTKRVFSYILIDILFIS